ncbi:sensor histidine kinase [Paenibacillus antri]|uniref:histidine kinase n=1 Tax=Paenibacillus antri TaxID=2582848 RepID=A0A5R9G7C9_9BACL|nr:histidine kinase [Paenibacillus antri]TLS51621.1 sensor histidine kinase [Paenibacillus antri]
MRSYWAWLAWLGAVWAAALLQGGAEAAPRGALGCALFFACYFASPLVFRRPAALFALLTGALLASVAALPGIGAAGALYALLLAAYLAGEAVYRLPGRFAAAFGALAAAGATASAWLDAADSARALPAAFALLFAAAAAAALTLYRRERSANVEGGARFEALLSEYRKLKRQAKSGEDAARAEERTNVARQIHDSVGHKLTSLLMQIEMFRLNAAGEHLAAAEQMKRLAQDSLEETRRAVKTLQEQEQGGLPALLRLIRNLEAESYLQVEFTVRHGALSVPLGNEPSIAVYRAIQEAMTNAMRHGASRKVGILLESPGGRVFRFEVSNDADGGPEQPVREGFGLTAMRERIEKAGGELTLVRAGGQFLVRGTFKLEQGEERGR